MRKNMDEELAFIEMVQSILDQSKQHYLATAKDAQVYPSDVFLTLDLIRIQLITNEVIEKFQGSKRFVMSFEGTDGNQLKLSIALEAFTPEQIDTTDLSSTIHLLSDKTEDEIRAILEAENIDEATIKHLLNALKKGK